MLEYIDLLGIIKSKIREARTTAVFSVNKELIGLYWQIGDLILKRQDAEGWGAKIIEKLSADLKQEFPEMKGFSTRNLKYMRSFAEEYEDRQFVQEVLAQLTWYHNITLIEKISDFNERKWYIEECVKNGWSRNILVMQIESNLFKRLGKAVSNFDVTLPKEQSDMAVQTLKDPYIFDFLSLGKEATERELEKELVRHITFFLLELGTGFAFIGNQYKITVDDDEYFIDLLFYHLKLKCYIVVELKSGEFKPEYAGKLNFYLSAVDANIKSPEDNSSIGLILCKDKKKLVAEYSLKDISKPIGISEYQLTNSIPENLKINLPSIEEIEEEMRKIDANS